MSKKKRIIRKIPEKPESKLEEDFLALILDFGIPKPVLQYHFHSSRQWRFDFCWPDKKVAVEIQGVSPSQHPVTGLAHNSINRMYKDYEKHNVATTMGWSILYFMYNDLYEPNREQTISIVKGALRIQHGQQDHNNKRGLWSPKVISARREFDKILNRYSS